ncbi:MAG TPA: protein kinase [Thermoanaerobaculia bacterium]|nr:protein kinase [Thermoanaerobaculia bacterium]
MPIAPGTRIGQYEILSSIGTGGMGEVYLARDTQLGRNVAIKLLAPHLQRDDDALKRFEREAKAVSSLNHPHILTIYGFGAARLPGRRARSHYMVMEYIEGDTLRKKLEQQELKTNLLQHLAQAADALAKAHSLGVIHRDLKPDNIMITSDGYAKVLDFGLAKLDEHRNEASADSITKFRTEPGRMMGTAYYMSPEQFTGGQIDHRSDIFSFGTMLYEIASGKMPFEGTHVFEVISRIEREEPPPLPPDTPEELRRIILRCLEKDPNDRFQSMKEVAESLHAVPRIPGVTARPSRSKGKSHSMAKSIAVLPFLNASNDPAMEYLSDGITEEVIRNLAQLQRIRVMARSTVFFYKGSNLSPQEIGQQLAVASVVTGKVQRIGEQLVVNIELVRARDGTQLWGDRFRKPFSNAFDLPEEIAMQISEKLALQLTASDKKRLAQRPTRAAEAYEYYLKGRYHANKRTADAVARAIDDYQQAIAIDAAYAPAWAGLADCYLLRSGMAFASPQEGFPRVKDAARRAIELDPTLAAPHATLGALAAIYHWEWQEAEKEFRRALQLDYSYATAHHWYSIHLNITGRREDAVVEAEIALSIDPLSLPLNVQYGYILHYARRDAEAIACCEKALELDANFVWAHFVRGCCYATLGRFADAVAEFERAIAISAPYPEILGALGHAAARNGDTERARTILADLRAMEEKAFVSPAFIAQVHAGLDESDLALDELDRFVALRSGELAEVVAGSSFEKIRTTPRFAALQRRLAIPAPNEWEPITTNLSASRP